MGGTKIVSRFVFEKLWGPLIRGENMKYEKYEYQLSLDVTVVTKLLSSCYHIC